MKSFGTIMLEAGVVGAGLVLIAYLLVFVIYFISGGFKMSHPHFAAILFFSGAVFHIICEYTQLNKYYVDNYYKK